MATVPVADVNGQFRSLIKDLSPCGEVSFVEPQNLDVSELQVKANEHTIGDHRFESRQGVVSAWVRSSVPGPNPTTFKFTATTPAL
jgi:hypothetical protein